MSGVPLIPFHFGERTTDYAYIKDGVEAGSVFTGSFVSLNPLLTVAQAETLLAAAVAQGEPVLLNAARTDPCYYWDDVTFNQTQFVADVVKFGSLLTAYQANILGILMLNEPHNPDTGCTPVPASVLYSAAQALRAEFVTLGLSPGFLLGYGSHPGYFVGVPADGTINLSNTQYAPQKGALSAFIVSQEADAAAVGHKLYFTVNAVSDGADLATHLEYLCLNLNSGISPIVGYWSWNQNGGNQVVPITDLVAAANACAALSVAPVGTPVLSVR